MPAVHNKNPAWFELIVRKGASRMAITRYRFAAHVSGPIPCKSVRSGAGLAATAVPGVGKILNRLSPSSLN